MLWSFLLILNLAVYIIGSRFKAKFQKLMLFDAITTYFMINLALELASKYSLQEDQILYWMKTNMGLFLHVNFLLLAPSIEYISYVYAPLHTTSVIFCVIRHSLEKKIIIGALFTQVALLFFWYILQRRELKRFFEQQDVKEKEIKATEKEIELRNVLNL